MPPKNRAPTKAAAWADAMRALDPDGILEDAIQRNMAVPLETRLQAPDHYGIFAPWGPDVDAESVGGALLEVCMQLELRAVSARALNVLQRNKDEALRKLSARPALMEEVIDHLDDSRNGMYEIAMPWGMDAHNRMLDELILELRRGAVAASGAVARG